MRLFIVLALFTVPAIIAQLYFTDSHALTGMTTQQDVLFSKPIISKKYVSERRLPVDVNLSSKEISGAQAKNEQEKFSIDTTEKTKKVLVVESRRNSQGMHLLSVLLLLKDKNK